MKNRCQSNANLYPLVWAIGNRSPLLTVSFDAFIRLKSWAFIAIQLIGARNTFLFRLAKVGGICERNTLPSRTTIIPNRIKCFQCVEDKVVGRYGAEKTLRS